MKTTAKLPTAVANFISMAKEDYKAYETTYNISRLISFEKYRDRVAKMMKISSSEADILING